MEHLGVSKSILRSEIRKSGSEDPAKWNSSFLISKYLGHFSVTYKMIIKSNDILFYKFFSMTLSPPQKATQFMSAFQICQLAELKLV